jgi:hypothetical protein
METFVAIEMLNTLAKVVDLESTTTPGEKTKENGSKSLTRSIVMSHSKDVKRCQSKNKQGLQCGFPDGHYPSYSHGNGPAIAPWRDDPSHLGIPKGRYDTVLPSLSKEEDEVLQKFKKTFGAEERAIIIHQGNVDLDETRTIFSVPTVREVQNFTTHKEKK